MNERIKYLAEQAGFMDSWFSESGDDCERELKKFAQLIVKECIDKIETYRIPVGNSAARYRLACEWTYDALKEIRGEIKEHFGVEE
jgi:hypothetical protein